MTTTEHPIQHRSPALIVDVCFAAEQPITGTELRRAAREAGHAQADRTIGNTVDDLVNLGALRRHHPTPQRGERRPPATIVLTDLGRAWLAGNLDTLPTITTDGDRYTWARHHEDDDEVLPPAVELEHPTPVED